MARKRLGVVALLVAASCLAARADGIGRGIGGVQGVGGAIGAAEGIFPKGGAAAGGGGCSQSTALQARMDGGQNSAAVQTLVCGLASNAILSKLDALYVFATNSTANANLNWVQNLYNLTKVGTVTFSANNGYTGDGTTGYFTTGFTPSTAAGNFAQNSASMGYCILTSRTTSQNYVVAGGVGASGIFEYVQPLFTSAGLQLVFALHDSGKGFTASQARGQTTITQGTSSATAWQNNVTFGTDNTVTTQALGNGAFYVLGFNNNGTAANWSTDQAAMVFWGGNLSGTDATNLYNLLHAYFASVGTAAGC